MRADRRVLILVALDRAKVEVDDVVGVITVREGDTSIALTDARDVDRTVGRGGEQACIVTKQIAHAEV